MTDNRRLSISETYYKYIITGRAFMKKLYAQDEIQQAQCKISRLLPDYEMLNKHFFAQFYKAEITQDFTRKDLKRISISKCKFIDSIFNGVAATGSKFTEVQFFNCDFSGSNFQYCYFNKSFFGENTLIKGANFSHSVFVECVFEMSTILECTLFDCRFENCSFISSTVRTNTLENSTMQNCILKNIDLSHINLEYMKFEAVKMQRVTLSPYQIPYIIGGPCYLNNTFDEIYVYTANGNITCQEYCNLFDDLAVFFYSHGEYFPLANIYIALQKHEQAFECIQLGIREASDYFDFRMVKHLCKLACSNDGFSHAQLKQLYDLVTDLSYDNEWDFNTLHSYMLNIGEIRELLLNNVSNAQRVELLIKTNIHKDDLEAVNSLYNKINEIIRENCSNKHVNSIELRHNSPYEIFITCVDMLPNILTLIGAVYSGLAAWNKFVDIYKNFEEARKVHQQVEYGYLEQEEKRLDIAIKKKQLEKMSEETVAQKPTSSSGIYLINEIEHNIKCSNLDVAKNIAPEYLHYKYKKNLSEQ